MCVNRAAAVAPAPADKALLSPCLFLRPHRRPSIPATLPETIRDGKPNFPKAHGGLHVWEWFQANPEWQDNFNDAMQGIDALSRAALMADVDWQRFTRFIDVGGANGSVLNALLLENPDATGVLWICDASEYWVEYSQSDNSSSGQATRAGSILLIAYNATAAHQLNNLNRRAGVLFDQPHVTEAAEKGWQVHHEKHSSGVAPLERIEFVGGSFFDGGLRFVLVKRLVVAY